jgi:hypothetical protein
MSLTDPDRYLEAILMAAITSEGLEMLTERLVRDEFPEAYRTGPGQDAGVDVLSDRSGQPERAWQAKNYFHTDVDWDKCRKSLASAMKGPKPRHYTFVFPRKLKKGELKYWRETFHPSELAKYVDLEKLDFDDDLPQRIKKHPDLIDEMSGGAVSEYALKIVGGITRGEASPPKPAGAVRPEELSRLASEAGNTDEHFAYEVSGREVGAGDVELPDRMTRFTMSYRPSDLPTYSLALREGDSVSELRAQPRPGVELEPPEAWFANTSKGREARMLARLSLAKGSPIELSGNDVGVKMAQAPEQFRGRMSQEGVARAGTLNLGLSEPIAMVVTLMAEGQPLPQVLSMYRVPPLAEDDIAYGGALGGVTVFLDLSPVAGAGGSGETSWAVDLSLNLSVAGETGREALRGIGFAQAFGKAERLRFECPGLLPERGLEIGSSEGEVSNQEILEAAAIIAAALALLEKRDDTGREMPVDVSLRDRLAAQMTYQVLSEGKIEVETEGEFDLFFPVSAAKGKDVAELVEVALELPPFAEQSTGVMARQELVGIRPTEILGERGDLVIVRCQSDEQGGRIVLSLAEEAPIGQP